MIIKREFVPFWKLKLDDKEAGEIFDRAFNESFPDNEDYVERKCELYRMFLNLSLYQREMSWAFRRIGDIIEGFDKLDRERPYDNGFDFSDVNKIDIAWKDEDSLKLHLINRFEDTELIVKIVELKTDKRGE